MNKWIVQFLRYLGFLEPDTVYYIGGSDVLPPPLKPEEEAALLARLEEGDPEAKSRLIERNLRLVVYIARRFENTGVNIEDLISIGTIGLIKAVDTYDPARTVRFASYASQCIQNELRMHLRRVRREAGTLSLQEPLEGENGMLTLADTLPDEAVMEEDCERRDAAARLRTLVEQLPERDRQLLTLRYGLGGGAPLTQQEVAARFGISRSYVSRLEKRALSELARRW